MRADGADVPMLEVRGLRVELGGATIVEHADLTAWGGRVVAVVGPNGAGKTTLVRAAVGIERASGGTIRWAGSPLEGLRGRRLARMRAFVPQRGRVPAGMTVRDAVMIGRSAQIGPLRRPTAHDREMVSRAIERTAVERFAERPLTTLSGGELQRVQIAVALAQDAPVLIADEPTSSLDLGATATIARLLRRLADDGLAVVLVLHDLALASSIADEVVVVAGGRTVAAGPPAEVLTREMLASVWEVDAELENTSSGWAALHVDWLGHHRKEHAL